MSRRSESQPRGALLGAHRPPGSRGGGVGDRGLREPGRGRPFRAAAGTEPGLGMGWAWAGVAAHPHAGGGGAGPRPGPAWSFPSGGAPSLGGPLGQRHVRPAAATRRALGLGWGRATTFPNRWPRPPGRTRAGASRDNCWFCSEVTADVCLRCHGNGLTSQFGRGTFPG